ncbi:MAG: SMC family ATPase [Rhodocyclaceae bacterium]|nr:SMC family ATPase [Rhodocyclaceae bacterium]
MKPLLLEMQAFGPFGRRQIIDFRRLGDGSFFLIHGPTGSGKTTILDGICFALFGDSSGGERDGRQMRSHHAPPELLTEVLFEFELGAERYRVERVPEQIRPARRGGGETRQAPKAALWRLSGAGGHEQARPLATRWGEVGGRVAELLGFESRQFRQVIVLPQGRFRDFLVSRSQDRERILQSLFGTEFYKRIEDALKQAASELEREAGELRTRRRTLLDQAAVDGDEALAGRIDGQQAALEQRRQQEREAAEEAARREQLLAAARAAEARFVEWDAACAEATTSEGEAPHWQRERERLQAALRAARVLPPAERAEALAADGDQAGVQLDAARAAAAKAATARTAAEQALAAEQARAAEIDAAIRRQGELEALQARVSALAEIAERARLATKVRTGADAALYKADQALAEAIRARDEMLAGRRQAELKAAAVDGLRAEAQLRRERVEARRALDGAEREHEAAGGAHSEAGRQVASAGREQQTARDDLQQVRAAWAAGLAGRLAARLAAGEPCPVCGATDHPAPAAAAGEAISDQALQQADDRLRAVEQHLRQCERNAGDARQRLALAGERVEAARRALAEDTEVPTATLEARQAEAATRLAEAEAAARQLADAGNRAELAERQVAAAEAAQRSARAACEHAREHAGAEGARLAAAGEGIPAELSDPAKLAAALDDIRQRQARLRAARDDAERRAREAAAAEAEANSRTAAASERHAELAGRRREADAALEARLAENGFDGAAAFRAALLGDEALAALDEAIATFETALRSARQRRERATKALDGQPRPDVDALRQAFEQASEARVAAGKAVQQAASALDADRALAASLAALARDYGALEARYAVHRQVADVASGNNPRRMSLQRYVLATLLEDVLAATTRRLRVMSRGRYEMRRRVDPVDQRSAAGLDLEIFDHYTGQAREAGTLSGGESFLASLALALGLADVVQSSAGGIRLEEIFVDEGFGTLDPEALDHAIRALKDLQQSGRMVGIISHVAELKEWIDVRLELTTTPAGSVAAFVD